MPRSVLPSEDCVFRLDSQYGFNQAFPMTFNNVGLSDDGFEFNGESSFIRHPYINTWIPNSDDFTFESVFLPSVVDVSHVAFSSQDNETVYKGISIYIMNDNRIRFHGYDGDVSISVYSDTTVNPHMKYHVIAIREGDFFSLYVNGILENDTTYSTIDSLTDTFHQTPLYVGCRDLSNFFKGTIKQASIYNRALTAQEVADRYNQSTFLFLNDTPTPTQQAYLDWQDSRIIGRSR
jgi:hypothetical protein